MNTAAKVGAFFLVGPRPRGAADLEDRGHPHRQAARPEGPAEFKDVAGLDEKSTVRMAGVRVGKVAKIRLDPRTGKARRRPRDRPDVELRQGASAAIANLGLLGEKYVELFPGPPAAPPLPEGSTLKGDMPV